MRTKSDLFRYLFDLKSELFYKAQEAEDLSNPESATELRAIANQIDKVTKRLVKEMG